MPFENTRNLSCCSRAPSIETVTPTSFSTIQSMISSRRNVAFVVRLAFTCLPSGSARSFAYASADFNILKLSSVSPPKNVRFTLGESPDSANMKSTDCLGGFVHEPRLRGAFDNAVLAVLVAVAAREIALARDVEHQRLERDASLCSRRGRRDGG